jgi:hypothetical protein
MAIDNNGINSSGFSMFGYYTDPRINGGIGGIDTGNFAKQQQKFSNEFIYGTVEYVKNTVQAGKFVQSVKDQREFGISYDLFSKISSVSEDTQIPLEEKQRNVVELLVMYGLVNPKNEVVTNISFDKGFIDKFTAYGKADEVKNIAGVINKSLEEYRNGNIKVDPSLYQSAPQQSWVVR